MKIAVTYENGQVFQHFGHTAQFKLYDAENGAVVSSEVVDTNGSGHGALAGFLSRQGVDCLICGGIGGGAQMALAEAGIRLYAGCSGDADQRVAELLNGTLQFAEAATCDHHHGERHPAVRRGRHLRPPSRRGPRLRRSRLRRPRRGPQLRTPLLISPNKRRPLSGGGALPRIRPGPAAHTEQGDRSPQISPLRPPAFLWVLPGEIPLTSGRPLAIIIC